MNKTNNKIMNRVRDDGKCRNGHKGLDEYFSGQRHKSQRPQNEYNGF